MRSKIRNLQKTVFGQSFKNLIKIAIIFYLIFRWGIKDGLLWIRISVNSFDLLDFVSLILANIFFNLFNKLFGKMLIEKKFESNFMYLPASGSKWLNLDHPENKRILKFTAYFFRDVGTEHPKYWTKNFAKNFRNLNELRIFHGKSSKFKKISKFDQGFENPGLVILQ